MGLLSFIYGLGLQCRRSLVKPQRLPARVISVGNITLGGTGKTPAVIAIAEEAEKRGLGPCILTRGYKGKAKGPCLVKSSEHGIQKTNNNPPCPPFAKGGNQLSPTLEKGGRGDFYNNVCFGPDAGDEPALMAERLKDVPIIKCADRYMGGMFAISNFKLQISNLMFILDDGFQHWRLHRDIDVLLIDATNPFGNEKLFPEGRLREPLAAMERADIIVITKSDMAGGNQVEELVRKIRQYNREAPVFRAAHRPSSLVNARGETVAADMMKNRKVYAFAGIANPDSFTAGLTSLGFSISAVKSFRDHYRYTQKDIDRIITEAAGADLVTTEKDMVKLKELRLPGNLFALRIEFRIEDAFYDILFRDI